MTGWIIKLISSTGYFGIALLMFIENIFPPIPSEFIMPLTGYLVAKGQFSLWVVIIAGTLGTLAGALPLYYLGRKVGKESLKNFVEKHGRWLTLSNSDIERADDWFSRHGSSAVFICRLIPGIRSLISIPAGFNRMNIWKFLLFSFLGTGIWTALLAGAGYLLGSSFKQIGNYLDIIGYVVFGIILFLYIRRLVQHKIGNN